MGWSCAAAASDSMDAISHAAFEEDKRRGNPTSNSYEHKGRRYFWEVSRTEHEDGAITGIIHMCVREDNTPDKYGSYARRVGSFRIEPNGRASRGPAFFKKHQRINS